MARIVSVLRLVLAAAALAAVGTLAVDAVAEDRLVNLLSYFTIESNILASVVFVVTSVVVLSGRPSTGATLTLWRGLAAFAMVTTGIVYVALLRNVDVQTPSVWTNAVLHYVMPIALLVDWLVTPRARISVPAALRWLAFPLLYLAYSLVRGPMVDWYPYPFIDARLHGAGGITLTCIVLAVAMAVLATVLALLPAPRVDGAEPATEPPPSRV